MGHFELRQEVVDRPRRLDVAFFYHRPNLSRGRQSVGRHVPDQDLVLHLPVPVDARVEPVDEDCEWDALRAAPLFVVGLQDREGRAGCD